MLLSGHLFIKSYIMLLHFPDEGFIYFSDPLFCIQFIVTLVRHCNVHGSGSHTWL